MKIDNKGMQNRGLYKLRRRNNNKIINQKCIQGVVEFSGVVVGHWDEKNLKFYGNFSFLLFLMKIDNKDMQNTGLYKRHKKNNN